MTSPLSGVRSNQLSYRPIPGRPAHPSAGIGRLQGPAPVVKTETGPTRKRGDQKPPPAISVRERRQCSPLPASGRPEATGGPTIAPARGALSRKPKRVSAQNSTA